MKSYWPVEGAKVGAEALAAVPDDSGGRMRSDEVTVLCMLVEGGAGTEVGSRGATVSAAVPDAGVRCGGGMRSNGFTVGDVLSMLPANAEGGSGGATVSAAVTSARGGGMKPYGTTAKGFGRAGAIIPLPDAAAAAAGEASCDVGVRSNCKELVTKDKVLVIKRQRVYFFLCWYKRRKVKKRAVIT